MNIRALYKLNNIIVSGMFLGMIYVPFGLGILEKDIDISAKEKRKLADFPNIELRVGSLKRFPKRFDEYYSDHFGGRNWLNNVYRYIKYRMGDSSSIDVTLGSDGWLFLGSAKKGYKRYNDPIGDFRNINLYSQKELKQVAEYMQSIKNWLNSQGIEYMFVIAPNKHTIYPEYLPDYITKVNSISATDQLVNYLKNHTDVPVVDLREAILEKKSEHRLYYKTDTHWNYSAGNYAQYKIMQQLQHMFPNQITPKLSKLKYRERRGGDLATMIGVHSFSEMIPLPVPSKKDCTPVKKPSNARETKIFTTTCKGQKLSAIVFRDSFFNALKPYFSRRFKRVTYSWGVLDFKLLKKLMKSGKPDIVIEEIVERKLPYHPKPIPKFKVAKKPKPKVAKEMVEIGPGTR
jgi:alginate O-acetyltransferase complex protein AlgJ